MYLFGGMGYAPMSGVHILGVCFGQPFLLQGGTKGIVCYIMYSVTVTARKVWYIMRLHNCSIHVSKSSFFPRICVPYKKDLACFKAVSPILRILHLFFAYSSYRKWKKWVDLWGVRPPK